MKNKILEFLESEEDERLVTFESNLSTDEIEKNIINLELSRIDKKYQDCIVLEREFPSGLFGRGYIFSPGLSFEELKAMYESASLISYIEKKLQLKKIAITAENILDYCRSRREQLAKDYDSVNDYRYCSPGHCDKKQKELKLQVENAIATGNKKQWLIELSVKSIDNYNLWKNKIQFAGNDKSCWWAGKGCYQKSSSWFGNLQDSRQGLAIYFYRKADETNNTGYGEIYDGIEWTLSGRLWAVKDNNNCLQFFNNYYKFGEKSELINLLGLNNCSNIDVFPDIYINDNKVFHYGDNINENFICNSCDSFFKEECEDEEEELTDDEILDNWENNHYDNDNLEIPKGYRVENIRSIITTNANMASWYNRFMFFVNTYDISTDNVMLAFTAFWDSDYTNIMLFFNHIFYFSTESDFGIIANNHWNSCPWEIELLDSIR